MSETYDKTQESRIPLWLKLDRAGNALGIEDREGNKVVAGAAALELLGAQTQAAQRGALGIFTPFPNGASAGILLSRYRAAVTAAGGTPVASQLDAIEQTLAELIADRSDPLSIIVEMHIPMGGDGDLAAALTKLIAGYNNSGQLNYALTNNGLVSGDYTATGGIDPGVANTTKYIDSDVRISQALNGIASSPSLNIGMMAMSLRKHTTGKLIGLTNSGNYYVSDAANNYFAGSNGVGPAMDPERALLGVEGYSSGGSNIAQIIANGVATKSTASATMLTSVGSSGVRVFAADISAKSNPIYGGYILYRAPATREQRTAMARFMRRANLALGRPVGGDGSNTRVLRIDGDSIASTANSSGAGVSAANNWAQLVADALGLSRHAMQDTAVSGSAVGGRGLVASSTGASGIWGIPDANVGGRTYQQTALGRQCELGGFCLGVNDNLSGADANTYAAVLDTVVSDYLATGIDPDQYFLCTPPIRDGFVGTGSAVGRTYATAGPYAAAVRSVARKYRLRVVPFYESERIKNSAATSWNADGVGVHPEIDIHAVMADVALSYLSMPAWKTW